MPPLLPTGSRTRLLLTSAGALLLLVAAGWALTARRVPPHVPMVNVVRGEFVDVVELQGEIRPLRSRVVSAPMQAGELQIVKLAKNGATVSEGDLLVEFDASTIQRTRQEKQSELRQAQAEIDQARAQARIAEEDTRTALMRARYDVDRAALDVVDRNFVARLELERARLTLDDARQRLREAEARAKADQAAHQAAVASAERKREKVQADLDRAERALLALQLRAPTAGVVNILPNYRTSGMMSAGQEFREGDRAWSGAAILELPDLTSVRLTARLEEADRGRIGVGQPAVARLDAIPDREYRATVSDISLLTRVDFSSGWPPPKDFDLTLDLDDADARLKPGMSAAVRIQVGRLADALLVPADAVSLVNGRPTVYRLDGSSFVACPVEIARRGREQIAVSAGVEPGDRLAARRPPADLIADR